MGPAFAGMASNLRKREQEGCHALQQRADPDDTCRFLAAPGRSAQMVVARTRGDGYDAAALDRGLTTAVAEVVRQQIECGLDIVNDGELSKFNSPITCASASPVMSRSQAQAAAGSRSSPATSANSPAISPIIRGRRAWDRRPCRSASRRCAMSDRPI